MDFPGYKKLSEKVERLAKRLRQSSGLELRTDVERRLLEFTGENVGFTYSDEKRAEIAEYLQRACLKKKQGHEPRIESDFLGTVRSIEEIINSALIARKRQESGDFETFAKITERIIDTVDAIEAAQKALDSLEGSPSFRELSRWAGPKVLDELADRASEEKSLCLRSSNAAKMLNAEANCSRAKHQAAQCAIRAAQYSAPESRQEPARPVVENLLSGTCDATFFLLKLARYSNVLGTFEGKKIVRLDVFWLVSGLAAIWLSATGKRPQSVNKTWANVPPNENKSRPCFSGFLRRCWPEVIEKPTANTICRILSSEI